MKRFRLPPGSLILLVILFSTNLQASDFAKEKRWADQIVDGIMTGEAQWLQADGHKFLSIYTASMAKKTVGGAIIIHGVGVHPNWTDLIHPLRTRLPESGWHTLSLQMPILPNEADIKEYAPLFPEIAPRINAGIAFLKAKGAKNIVIVAHSLGATMAGYYLATNKAPDIRTLVAIGSTGLTFKDPKQDYIQSLKKIHKPILDLTGADDLPEVLESAALKLETAKAAGNKNYHQIKIPDTNHFLVGKEEEMIKAVTDWLKQYGS